MNAQRRGRDGSRRFHLGDGVQSEWFVLRRNSRRSGDGIGARSLLVVSVDLTGVAVLEVRDEPLQEVEDFGGRRVRELARHRVLIAGPGAHGHGSAPRNRSPGGWRFGLGEDLKVELFIDLREIMLRGGGE